MVDAGTEITVWTVQTAVNAYFDANAKKIDQAHRVAVSRFVSWAGPERTLTEISAHEMTLFQDAQGQNVADLPQRLLPVKAFFAHAKKKAWTDTNMGVHLRVKKTVRPQKETTKGAAVQIGDAEAVEMTAAGLTAARSDLDRLKAERPKIVRAITDAAADKDFRENAPLDAARDQQAHLESQIRELEHQVAHAVVVDRDEKPAGIAHLGSTATVTNLVSSQTVRYTLVGQNEVDAAAGRISAASPVGQALVGHGPGDEVEVTAPSGAIRFRIEAVEG